MAYRFISCFLLLFFCLSLVGCAPKAQQQPVQIIYRDWTGAMPQSVLNAFTNETGIQVKYLPYETQESVLEEMRTGEQYDVVVLENELIPGALRDQLLAELHFANLTNFKNLSPNFRDLAYDPHNTHSIPYSWGTTGLVVRCDLVQKPVTRWADLWAPEYIGKVITWNSQRYMIGIALKSLNYSVNSEDPQELEAAKQKLIALKPNVRQMNWESGVAAPFMINGEAVLAVGQVDELMAGQKAGSPVRYVMPEEGAIIWGDNWVIPANSIHQASAEKLINFFLRPEISAEIINTTYYWLPNDAALPLVRPELRSNTDVLPDAATLKNAEILYGLSPEGEKRYQQIWEQVQAAQ